MNAEQIEQLALEIEAEELIGSEDQVIEIADISPVLEYLWERGVDLLVVLEEDVPEPTNPVEVEE